MKHQMTILIDKPLHKIYKQHVLDRDTTLTEWIKKALVNQLKADNK